MTKREAQAKAKRSAKINGRPFRAVRVEYANGKKGWDVTPSKRRNPSKRKTRKRVSSALKKWMAKVKPNPGRKVKGGRAVSLRNFTGSVVRMSNGQVVIRGKGKR